MNHHLRFTALHPPAFASLLAALFPALALAQTAAPASNAPGVSSMAILQMLLGLALIIGILFFGAFALRKLNGGKGFGNSGPLRVVGGLMIGPRERIVMIEVGESWIVIGVVPGQIKTLHTLPKGELPLAQSATKPFGQWLKQMSERKHAQE